MDWRKSSYSDSNGGQCLERPAATVSSWSATPPAATAEHWTSPLPPGRHSRTRSGKRRAASGIYGPD